MSTDLPAWTPADPASLPALPPVVDGAGPVVVLVAAEGALAGGWAGKVAADAVTGWSRAGGRFVLADAGISTPTLHEALALPNGEGLVDALRWGASVQRVVQRPEGRRFLAVTAGTADADGDGVLANPRWPALCAGFREAGVTFVVLAPVWEEGLGRILAEADAVVVLAEDGEDLSAVLPAEGARVLAVMGPAAVTSEAVAEAAAPAQEAAPVAPEEPSVVPDEPPVAVPETTEPAAPWEPEAVEVAAAAVPDEVTEVPEATESEEAEAQGATPAETDAVAEDGWDATDDSLAAPEIVPEPAPDVEPDVDAGVEPGEPEMPAPDPGHWRPAPDAPTMEPEFELPAPVPVMPTFEEIVEESEARRPRSRTGIYALILIAVAAAVAIAGWLGLVEIPGVSRDEAPEATPTETAAPIASAPATPASPVAGFSVALGAYQDGAVARSRVAALEAQVAGVLFVSVPVEVEGAVYHRVLAGPAADSADAVSLAARVAEGASLDPSTWVARRTPRAFELAEMPDRSAADARATELADLGIDAYVLAVDYSDGSVRYRVYAGAFADPTEASYFSSLLAERGMSSATLSDRIGRLPE